MIQIGKSGFTRWKGMSCLCADVSIGEGEPIRLCFSVPQEREAELRGGRADAFVLALLPAAMRGGHEIRCEDPVSDRLQYQLNQNLIPALMLEADPHAQRFARVTAPLAWERGEGAWAAAAVCADETALRRTLERHGQDSLYPLTHIAVWNLEGEAGEAAFQAQCRQAEELARAYKLETLSVRSNLGEALHEDRKAVRLFWELACALALEPVLRVCLFSTHQPATALRYDPQDCSAYEQLVLGLASTEALTFYLSGPEGPRGEEEPREKIVIGAPYVEPLEDGARLCADVQLHGRSQVMWFSVGEEYAPYLTQDRADAFVAALLMPAMREGADLECRAPVSRRLLYQLNQLLIPILSAYIEEYHGVTVRAEPADAEVACAGAVCTGGTGGVDCMFTLMQDQELPKNSRYRLTHLFLASNGAIERGVLKDTLQQMVDRAERKLAPETGLKTFGINSNLTEILSEVFITVLNTRHAAVLLALQGLCAVGRIASAYGYFELDFRADNMSYYEALVSSCLSTECTAFFADGASFSRIQKLERLCHYPLARRVVHPCIDETAENNCGRCKKCVWTQTLLYTLGELDAFSEAFDVRAFHKRKTRILAEQLADAWIFAWGRSDPNPYAAEGLERVRERCAGWSAAKLLAAGIFTARMGKRACRKLWRMVRRLGG